MTYYCYAIYVYVSLLLYVVEARLHPPCICNYLHTPRPIRSLPPYLSPSLPPFLPLSLPLAILHERVRMQDARSYPACMNNSRCFHLCTCLLCPLSYQQFRRSYGGACFSERLCVQCVELLTTYLGHYDMSDRVVVF